VDACTGTGCIPLLLSHEFRDHGILSEIIAFDVAQEAINLALENAHRSNLLVQIKYGDVFNKNIIKDLEFPHLIDLITSNPPYIPYEDYVSPVKLNGVEKSVRMYEPSLALIGGTEFYRALTENLVIPAGANGFIFELGYLDQVHHVQQLLKSNTQWKVDQYYDSANNIRCVIGWKTNTNMAILQSLCNDGN
jgi:HemK-like putative methylase